MASSLARRLLTGEYEETTSATQQFYELLERRVCHALFRKPPPKPLAPNLLNLGCGEYSFPGWVNADDYAPRRRKRTPKFRPDWSLDITRPWKCEDNYWDGVFTEHVIEHLIYSEATYVFWECFRTLKPGAWLRVSVPDLKMFATYYDAVHSDEKYLMFPQPALAISFLTQMQSHKSVWDADLMIEVLTDLGYEQAQAVSFGEGTDERLIRDDIDKLHESMYIEAKKPGAGLSASA